MAIWLWGYSGGWDSQGNWGAKNPKSVIHSSDILLLLLLEVAKGKVLEPLRAGVWRRCRGGEPITTLLVAHAPTPCVVHSDWDRFAWTCVTASGGTLSVMGLGFSPQVSRAPCGVNEMRLTPRSLAVGIACSLACVRHSTCPSPNPQPSTCIYAIRGS